MHSEQFQTSTQREHKRNSYLHNLHSCKTTTILQGGSVNSRATYKIHLKFQNSIHMPPYGMGRYYMPQPMPPPINQMVISDDTMRTLVQALGRGVAIFPTIQMPNETKTCQGTIQSPYLNCSPSFLVKET